MGSATHKLRVRPGYCLGRLRYQRMGLYDGIYPPREDEVSKEKATCQAVDCFKEAVWHACEDHRPDQRGRQGMGECQCDVCKHIRQLERIMEKYQMTKAERHSINMMWEAMACEETDRIMAGIKAHTEQGQDDYTALAQRAINQPKAPKWEAEKPHPDCYDKGGCGCERIRLDVKPEAPAQAPKEK